MRCLLLTQINPPIALGSDRDGLLLCHPGNAGVMKGALTGRIERSGSAPTLHMNNRVIRRNFGWIQDRICPETAQNIQKVCYESKHFTLLDSVRLD
jgi:hypothetical protein